MLLEIYIFLQLLAFVALFIGIITKNKIGLQGNIPTLLIAIILFTALTFFSMNIEYEKCQNQILWMNTTNNDTSISNNIACVINIHQSSGLTWLNMGMGILSVLLLLITVFMDFKNVKRPL